MLVIGAAIGVSFAQSADRCPPMSVSSTIRVRATVISPYGITADSARKVLDVWAMPSNFPAVQYHTSVDPTRTILTVSEYTSPLHRLPFVYGQCRIPKADTLWNGADTVFVYVIYTDQ